MLRLVLVRWKVISGLEQRPAGFYGATAKETAAKGRGGAQKNESGTKQEARGGAGWRFVAIMRHFQPNYGNDVRKCAVSEWLRVESGGQQQSNKTISWWNNNLVITPNHASSWAQSVSLLSPRTVLGLEIV